MTQLLTTGDENAGQSIEIATSHRPEGMRVSTTPFTGDVGDSGSVHATNASNSALTEAVPDEFTFINGNAFAVVLAPSADWTFTANGCFWTYNGAAGKRFLFTLEASFAAVNALAGIAFIALDLDNALLGLVASTEFTESVVEESFTAAALVHLMTTSRLITPTPGSTVAPVFAFTGVDNLEILRLSMAFVQV